MIVDVNHTSFTVPDVGKAVAFWTDVLGFSGPPVVERTGEWVERVTGVAGARIKVAHLYGYGHHLEFIEYENGDRRNPDQLPDRPGVGHVCLEVKNIQGVFADLLAAGATRLGQMTELTGTGVAAVAAGYLRDPNGIIIELLEL